jgi:hypothetical protein
MTQRLLGPTGGRRRRRLLIVPILLVALGALLLVSAAQAVHDQTFQLDGDVLSSTQTTVGGTTQTIDWDSIFTASGTNVDPLPTGFDNAGFERDFRANPGCTLTATGSFCTADQTTFSTGSKDTLPISGWQCNFDNNVNSKIDVMNSYAATYTAPNGDEILYYALERNTNTGDANVGFWFLQSDVDCSTAGASKTFTGEHTDGDLLIVSAFTKGGDVSTINVYRWNGGANGSLGTTPVASGVDCRSTAAGDAACAVANRADITTPWLTANFKDGVGNTLRTGEFFEGGLNLTQSGLGGVCFNVFIGDTRSSQSLTATLFDYARGKLGACVPTMDTTASATTSSPVIPGMPVHDTATITITGATNPADPTGDVEFFLCGPIATGDCSTGGTDIGSGTLDGGTITDDGIATATSPDVNCPTLNPPATCSTATGVNPLAPGRYCFRAEWPGDVNYAGTSFTNDTDECFAVKDTSATTTAQNWLPNDTASVTTAGGTAVSGTVVFTLYGGADCTGAVLGTFTDTAAPYETNNTTVYTSNTTISWRAVFTPSDPNAVAGSSSHCETSTVTINNDIGS